jgi:hypothetical protein
MMRRSSAVGCAVTASFVFVAAMIECWDHGWHSPDMNALLLLWMLGMVFGIGVVFRADVGQLTVHRSDWLVVGTASRFTALAACVLGVLTSSVGAVVVATAIEDFKNLVVASILGSLWMATYPLHPAIWQRLLVRDLVVGLDGVRIGRKTTIPFVEIRAAHARARALEIEGKSGARWIRLLPTWAIANTVVARVRSRLAVDADVRGGRSPLARAGRPLEAWKRALVSPDYRAAAISTEEAAQVLVAGGAPLDERIGAALVLARSGDAERVRVAAAACVDRRVRVALERAAEDRLDEATLEAALGTTPRVP